jgi:nucleoside-diphosphate-sugar epimerase
MAEPLDNKESEMQQAGRLTAFITGGTGFAGSVVLSELLRDARYKTVIALRRKPLSSDDESDKLKAIVLEDFLKIGDVADEIKGIDHVFNCTGVPSASVAQEDYVRIEYDMPVAIAKAVYAHNPKCHWVQMSGMGAGLNASTLFGKTKAKLEVELSTIGFPRVSVVRPGGIMESGKSHRYWLYNVMSYVSFLLPRDSQNETGALAAAMIHLANTEGYPVEPFEVISKDPCDAVIYECPDINKIYETLTSSK